MELMIEVFKGLSGFDIILLTISPILLFVWVRWLLIQNKTRKLYQKRVDELEAQKCKGPHSWIDMDVNGENAHVCKDCCWSPSNEGYIKKFFVEAEVSQRSFRIEEEKNLELKLKELDISREMYDKIVNIKKDFVLEHLDNVLKGFKSKGE